jgi:creatinine amidohydrolase
MGKAAFLAELSWPEVEDYLRQEDRLILVTGSTEQHGRHLPLGTDCLIPTAIAARVAERTGVAVAPTLNFGMALPHLSFPGSIALKPETLARVITEVVESLYHHGFRRFLVINGHGGNIPALDCAMPLLAQLPDFRMTLGHWWREEVVQQIARHAFGGSGHAGPDEASALMAVRRDLAHLERARGASPGPFSASAQRLRELHPDGNTGPDPAGATEEIGERLLAAAVDLYVGLLMGL